ncbi:MAG: hypothetical protein ACFHW5_23120 [Verrucomicrobiota bacterium]|jgi:hypothetical protein
MFLHSAADHFGEKIDQWFDRSGLVDTGEVNALLDGKASVSEGGAGMPAGLLFRCPERLKTMKRSTSPILPLPN